MTASALAVHDMRQDSAVADTTLEMDMQSVASECSTQIHNHNPASIRGITHAHTPSECFCFFSFFPPCPLDHVTQLPPSGPCRNQNWCRLCLPLFAAPGLPTAWWTRCGLMCVRTFVHVLMCACICACICACTCACICAFLCVAVDLAFAQRFADRFPFLTCTLWFPSALLLYFACIMQETCAAFAAVMEKIQEGEVEETPASYWAALMAALSGTVDKQSEVMNAGAVLYLLSLVYRACVAPHVLWMCVYVFGFSLSLSLSLSRAFPLPLGFASSRGSVFSWTAPTPLLCSVYMG